VSESYSAAESLFMTLIFEQQQCRAPIINKLAVNMTVEDWNSIMDEGDDFNAYIKEYNGFSCAISFCPSSSFIADSKSNLYCTI
jgi:hypothetical protein